jgi:hypothetical protein
MVIGLVLAKKNFLCSFCVIPKEKWANYLVGELNASEYQQKLSRKLRIVKSLLLTYTNWTLYSIYTWSCGRKYDQIYLT